MNSKPSGSAGLMKNLFNPKPHKNTLSMDIDRKNFKFSPKNKKSKDPNLLGSFNSMTMTISSKREDTVTISADQNEASPAFRTLNPSKFTSFKDNN